MTHSMLMCTIHVADTSPLSIASTSLSSGSSNLVPGFYRNAILGPHWKLNAHSIFYVTRGNGRFQIVDNNGQQIFDEDVKEGKLFVVPQNLVVLIKASSQGFEWIAFKTNDTTRRLTRLLYDSQ